MGFPKYISQKETKIFHTKRGYDIKYGKERAEKGEIHREIYYFSGAKGGFLAGEGERREDFFLRSREIHTKRGATLTHQRQIFFVNRGEFLK